MKRLVKHIPKARSILISQTSTDPFMFFNVSKCRYAFMVVNHCGQIIFSFLQHKTLDECTDRYLEYQNISDRIRNSMADTVEDINLYYGIIARYDGKVYLMRPLHLWPKIAKLVNYLNKNKASYPGLEIDCLIDDHLKDKTDDESVWLN